ncbi:hypothetical protein EIP86_009477 [Pleurotus ostreatoroseus]|nr:hypothetical protein EIP86_009477 [Pleurotus ostreatoroseus]
MVLRLKLIHQSECLQPPDLSPASAVEFAAKPDPAFHGTEGPVKHSYSAQWSNIHSNLFETAATLGAPRNTDTGNGKNDGCMTAPVTVDATTAKRCYAASAYLEPNLHRKNLLVLTEAQVTKVLFEDDGRLKRAIGIECLKDGSLLQIKNVKRDVVVSAGSYQSPQILELSGIGNPAILSKFGIKTIIDLPGVGENLRMFREDHIGVPTIAEVNTKDETMDVLADPEIQHQKGLLATVPASAFVFLSADALGSEEDIKSWKEHAHAQCTDSFANVVPSLRSGLEKQYEIQQSFLDDKKHSQAELLNVAMHPFVLNAHPEPGKRYTSLLCALLHPFSRGTVHITSADPLVPPAIDPNYFANEADLACIVRALQFGLKVYRTQPFAGHVVKQVLPPADAIERGEEGLKDYIRGYSRQVFHAVGTAAMMPREDGGVVDPSLKIYGTSNLRVVDCSIVPFELSCHTQSIAYAVGEKVMLEVMA